MTSRRRISDLQRDQAGTTSLEWALLLAAVALPTYFISVALLNILITMYRNLAEFNGLPFP